MKRILALVMVSILLFSTTVFADNTEEITEIFSKTAAVSSVSGKMTLSTKLNEPLNLLETIPNDENVDIDYRLLVEELLGATAEIEYSYAASEDKKKSDISMSILLDTPITLNDSFKVEAWTKIGVWMKYDIADLSNPVYQIILKVPFEKNYLVMDFSEMMQTNPDMLSSGNEERMGDFQEELLDALLRHADIRKKSNEYTIRLDDMGAREYLLDCIALYRSYMAEGNIGNYESYLQADQMLQTVASVIERNSFLGEDGLVITIKKNFKGLISAEIEELHLCFNVYDLLEENGQSTEGLTREEGMVNLTIGTSLSLEKHNQTTVTIPELTEENSKLVFQSMDADYTPSLVAAMPPVFKDNHVYFPIESMAEQAGKQLSITKEDDRIVITYQDGTSVVVSGTSMIYDGEEIPAEVSPIIEENDIFYCMEELLYPLSLSQPYVFYNKEKKEFYISYHLLPEYEEEEAPMEDLEEEGAYIPMTLDYHFSLDRSLYQENNQFYMPVYEFVSSLFPGEFSFGNHSLTYTAAEENPFGIQMLSAAAGDDFITINGEKYPLEYEVKEVEGVLNIPFSFARELGLSGWAEVSQHLSDGCIMSYCSFYMDNPEYQKDEYYDDYVPAQLYFWVPSDQTPWVENGEVYVPLYDLLQEMFDGEFAFSENGLEYIADGENQLQIEKVSAVVGDCFVMVDDNKVSFENEIISVNDIIRVPISFTEQLGMETEAITAFYGTTYQFVMDNPSYPADETEEAGNWFYNLFL